MVYGLDQRVWKRKKKENKKQWMDGCDGGNAIVTVIVIVIPHILCAFRTIKIIVTAIAI
jgi:hypothetical protein